jgi:hypothetical protein
MAASFCKSSSKRQEPLLVSAKMASAAKSHFQQGNKGKQNRRQFVQNCEQMEAQGL